MRHREISRRGIILAGIDQEVFHVFCPFIQACLSQSKALGVKAVAVILIASLVGPQHRWHGTDAPREFAESYKHQQLELAMGVLAGPSATEQAQSVNE